MNYDNGQVRGHVPPRMPGPEYGPRPVPSGYPAHALPGNSGVRYASYQQQPPPPPMGYVQRGYAPYPPHPGGVVNPGGVNPYPGENGVRHPNFANSQPPPQQFYQGQPQQVYYQQSPPEYAQQFPPGGPPTAPRVPRPSSNRGIIQILVWPPGSILDQGYNRAFNNNNNLPIQVCKFMGSIFTYLKRLLGQTVA